MASSAPSSALVLHRYVLTLTLFIRYHATKVTRPWLLRLWGLLSA